MKDDVRVKDVALDENDFERDEKKKIKKNQRNICLALKLMGIKLSYDEFSDRLLVDGLDGYAALEDPAVDRMWLAIDERFGFMPGKDLFLTVVKDLARCNRFHPVREYLDSLEWDGEKRLNRWLVVYGGAKDTGYVRAVGRLMMIAAVRRVRKPGCKFDEMVILEGPQGVNKSTMIQTLAVKDDWFSDDLPLSADSKKFIEQFRGRWIVEASELSGMKKTQHDHLKSMLSRTHDRARLSYDRLETDAPRHCIIIGTTNDAKYFRDQTGNRRFWPVAVASIDVDALKREREQLWAEAAFAEKIGESIRLAKDLWAEASREQEERLEEEPWKEIIEEVLGEMDGKILKSEVREIIGRPTGQLTQFDAKRLCYAMRSLGWSDDKKLRFGGSPEHCWYRGEHSKQDGLRTIIAKIDFSSGKRVVKAQYEGGREEPM